MCMERGNSKFDERIQRIFIVALLNLVSVLLNSAMLTQNSLNAAIKNH